MQYTDIIGRITEAAWVAFGAVWLVSALFAKRTAKRTYGRWIAIRLLMVVIVIAVIERVGFNGTFLLWYIHEPVLRAIGAFLAVSGIALCMWARYHLGRNWGQPMSEKAGAELVTSGPYAYVRNPIYAGIILSIIGSCLVFGMLWTIILAPYIAIFVPSIFVEERIMARLFPDAYPAYKARTKRLIPWVW